MNKIKLTIQEIVDDFYSLGEEEGYLTGLSTGLELTEKDTKKYHDYMIDLMNKYLPNWKTKIKKDYFDKEKNNIEKGMILSIELHENFKHIFYQLV